MSSSRSSATSATTNNNIDQRMQQESGAVGISQSGGGTATINMLDGGTVAAAFGLGSHAIDQVTDFATGALSGAHHTAELALNGALHSVSDSKAAYADAAKQVATAYEDSKVGNRSLYMVGALVVGAVVLVVLIQKRGAA